MYISCSCDWSDVYDFIVLYILCCGWCSIVHLAPYLVSVCYRQRESDVSIYDHAPTAMEEDPYADSSIYEAIVHKKVGSLIFWCVWVCRCAYLYFVNMFYKHLVMFVCKGRTWLIIIIIMWSMSHVCSKVYFCILINKFSW